MGRRIVALAVEGEQFDIVGAVDRPQHPDIGKDAGLVAGTGPINVALTSEYPTDGDVVIDFSLPQATARAVEHCVGNDVGLVIGTTGLDGRQVRALEQAAEKIPIVYASNMSVGMNVLFNLVAQAAAMLGAEYDIEIVEAHHRFKKDSPSGSALSLARGIADATDRPFPDCLVHGRHGGDTPRQKGEIGMHAIRAGDITGRHSVIFSTLGETLTLSHDAHNRDNFVRGALRGALWLAGRAPGLYSMAQVMGLK